jgi:hypothetical protein
MEKDKFDFEKELEVLVKKMIKPFKMYHNLLSVVIFIIFVVGFISIGITTWKNHELSKKTANQIELVNKYYVLQNQQSILLKVVDENLRESASAKLGSAPMELKVQTAKILYDMSQIKQVPLHIICGLIETESGWSISATSSAGCVGLTQITPLYARVYLREKGINYKQDIWYDPTINVMCGISMLSDAQAEYVEKGKTKPEDWNIAIHSYFWGPSNTNQLFGKSDQRVSVPNMAYPMRIAEASKRYQARGL